MMKPSLPTNTTGARRPRRQRGIGFNNIEVQRGKIVRDIAILVLLAITIIVGSAALVGLVLQDVAIAESQAYLVEAVQTSEIHSGENGLKAAPDERFVQEIVPMALAGLGIAITALALTRTGIITGR